MASVAIDKSLPKFTNGLNARNKWKRDITIPVCKQISIDDFNKECGDVFIKYGSIVLDPSSKRQTTIRVEADNISKWDKEKETIYVITRDDIIMKIGGTRTGMKARFGSYCCGFCVPQRQKKNGESFPGKMSVTNAYLYHTIEYDLLENDSKWEFYCWELPVTKTTVSILGTSVEIICQTFHAYETVSINKFKMITGGSIPILCSNCDPSYR